MEGSVTFDVEVFELTTTFELDTRDLTIKSCTVNGDTAKFALGHAHEAFGSKLTVSLPDKLQKSGAKGKVTIEYATSPSSSACQWLPAASTAGKKHPYLFTQCQAIHARSLLPCQDCPQSKCSWSGRVTAPDWATVLMSALQEGEGVAVGTGKKAFTWKQPVPTCSYLIAIAVGELASKDISPRCRVWSEPSQLDKVAHEFAETETFLTTAESLTCPYVWGRYDVLCLPPSFPYGGMENPCLTFVTPTLLAGDRSLSDVIAHEISHSWTGNLVTNETWESFWLNEGWTMMLERKIMMRVRGKEGGAKGDKKYFDFLAAGGWSDLQDTIDHFTETGQLALTALIPPLEGIDPDDAFSSVPYEKGFNLLYAIQRRVGEDAFDTFIKDYINTFKFKLISSQGFRDYVTAYPAFSAKLSDLNWDAWFTQPGMPVERPTFDATLSEQCTETALAWAAGPAKPGPNIARQAQWAQWSSQQRSFMLDTLLTNTEKAPLSVATLRNLDTCYDLSTTKNSEQKFRWCVLCLRCGDAVIVPLVVSFLSTQGRMKYTRPLYRELVKSSVPRAKEIALATLKNNANFYHPICRKMVQQDLNKAVGGGAKYVRWGGVTAITVVAYFAWAVMRVRAHKCPIPFV